MSSNDNAQLTDPTDTDSLPGSLNGSQKEFVSEINSINTFYRTPFQSPSSKLDTGCTTNPTPLSENSVGFQGEFFYNKNLTNNSLESLVVPQPATPCVANYLGTLSPLFEAPEGNLPENYGDNQVADATFFSVTCSLGDAFAESGLSDLVGLDRDIHPVARNIDPYFAEIEFAAPIDPPSDIILDLEHSLAAIDEPAAEVNINVEIGLDADIDEDEDMEEFLFHNKELFAHVKSNPFVQISPPDQNFFVD